jgi:hypothetical protein
LGAGLNDIFPTSQLRHDKLFSISVVKEFYQ